MMNEAETTAPPSWKGMKRMILENTAQLLEEAIAGAHQAEKWSQVLLVRGVSSTRGQYL